MITTPFEERARELVSQMTLDEKISQMMHDAPAIERMGIPAYNWWNECLHGVGRAGIATVFPQAIGLAATWNISLNHEVATAIADEARAKHHEFVRNGVRGHLIIQDRVVFEDKTVLFLEFSRCSRSLGGSSFLLRLAL